jgi:RNA polymerase sigma factor (sigma-70 family)
VTVADNGVLTSDQVSEDDRRARLERLVRAAREGSLAAVDELVSELTPMLWHVARATSLSQPDAEDVVQTAWLNLVSHLDEIHSPAALQSWLVTTTRREAWRVRAAYRKAVPADHDWLSAIPDLTADSEERVIVKDEQRALWAALRELPPRCQELLRIVAFVPRPDYDVVAQTLGMPRGSVGPTRGRCLEKLRSALYGEGAVR